MTDKLVIVYLTQQWTWATFYTGLSFVLVLTAVLVGIGATIGPSEGEGVT